MKRRFLNISPAAALWVAAALVTGTFPATGAEDDDASRTRPDVQRRADPQANSQIVAGAGKQAVASGNPLWEISLEALSATRERPIFSPSRRRPVVAAPVDMAEPPPPPPPAEPEKPSLSLIGTVTGDHPRLAIFVSQTTNDVVRLHVGEDKDGWVLRSVDARTTTLVKDSREVTLAFPTPDTAAPPVGSFPPPPGLPPGFPAGPTHKPGRLPSPAGGYP